MFVCNYIHVTLLLYSCSFVLSYQERTKSVKLTQELLNHIRTKSCSRPNFCVNLVRELFTIEERRQSNVRGKKDKKQLNQQLMDLVKNSAFQMYPLATGEQQLLAWNHCIKAIDESCRRLNRANKEC